MFNFGLRPGMGRPVCLSVQAAGLIGAAVILMGGAQRLDRHVEAEELRVTDKDGTLRITLGILPDGRTAMSLRDAKGKPEIVMAVRPDGSRVLTFYSDGGTKGFLSIGLGRAGDATVALGGIGAPAGADLRALPNGASSLQFRDMKGKIRLSLGLQADGTPGLEFFDENGKRTSAIPAP